MKTAKDILSEIKASLYENILNRYFVISQIVLFVITFAIWKKIIVVQNIFIYSPTNYYPLQVFSVVFVLHIVLSVYSYKNDKYISSLLLGAITLYLLLILILEFLYIIYR